jgi:predicted nucleic acid-binding protein
VSWLLDTNALSELSRRKVNVGFRSWYESAYATGRVFTSAVAIGELFRGALLAKDGARRTQVLQWILGRVVPTMVHQIVGFDEATARTWAEVTVALPPDHRITTPDTFIAATAIHHGHILVTRNTRDMSRFSRLVIETPWT